METFLQHNTIESQKPKRGRPRKEIKKEDIEIDNTEVQKNVLPKYNTSEYNICVVGYDEIIPNVIEGVGVHVDMTTKDMHSTVLIVESECKSSLLREWRRGIGGIFNKDVKRYLLNNSYTPKYYSMTHDSGECFLIRLLSDLSLGEDISKDINIITIDGAPYVIVREVESHDSLISRFDTLSDTNGYLTRTTEFKEDDDDNDSYESEEDDENDELNFYEE